MNKLFYLAVIFALFFACQSDEQTSKEIIEVDTIQNEMSGNPSVENGDASATSPATQTDTTKNAQQLEKAKDVDDQLGTKVNKAKNPDNMNGSEDVDVQSNITLVPVISEADKAFYYVQILESPTKLAKNYFDKYFKSKQEVYVISEGGVYKYCVGKYKTEAEAKSYVTEVKTKYKFKKATVVSFSQSW